MIALILERDPPPLTQYVPGIPSELERIINKALTKDREQRYQTARDLLTDLRHLQQRLEVEAEFERSASAEVSEEEVMGGRARAKMATADLSAARTEGARTTSSAEYLVSRIKQHKAVCDRCADLRAAINSCGDVVPTAAWFELGLLIDLNGYRSRTYQTQ